LLIPSGRPRLRFSGALAPPVAAPPTEDIVEISDLEKKRRRWRWNKPSTLLMAPKRRKDKNAPVTFQRIHFS
jgi:hypothetical protein